MLQAINIKKRYCQQTTSVRSFMPTLVQEEQFINICHLQHVAVVTILHNARYCLSHHGDIAAALLLLDYSHAHHHRHDAHHGDVGDEEGVTEGEEVDQHHQGMDKEGTQRQTTEGQPAPPGQHRVHHSCSTLVVNQSVNMSVRRSTIKLSINQSINQLAN